MLTLTNVSKTFLRPATKQSFAHAFSGRLQKRLTIKALDAISFSVQAGEIVSIEGANGRGKSTLLKLIAGIYLPTSGTIIRPKRICPILDANPCMYRQLEVEKNVIHYLKLLGLPPTEAEQKTIEILTAAGLLEKKEYHLTQLSRGEQNIITLLASLAVPADLYLIDEMLDPLAENFFEVARTWLLQRISNGSALILVSHNQAAKLIASRTINL